jgi:hypothetical protein
LTVPQFIATTIPMTTPKPLSDKEFYTFHALKSRLLEHILAAQTRIHALEQQLAQEKQHLHTMQQQVIGGIDPDLLALNHPPPTNTIPQKHTDTHDNYQGEQGDHGDQGNKDDDGDDDDDDDDDGDDQDNNLSSQNKDKNHDATDHDHDHDHDHGTSRDAQPTPEKPPEKKKRGRPPNKK